jgi:acetyl esterase/lipase
MAADGQRSTARREAERAFRRGSSHELWEHLFDTAGSSVDAGRRAELAEPLHQWSAAASSHQEAAGVRRAVQAHVRRLALWPASHEPTGLGRGVEVTLKNVAGWPVYHTAPSGNPDGGNCAVFPHGGGYINEIVCAHWRFVGYLTRLAGVRCVVPIYPLAPRATAKDVVPGTGGLLRKLFEEAAPEKVTVIGNSAGAGLALAPARWLRDSGYRQPNALVLISPRVNAAMNTKGRVAIATRNPLQDIPGIVEAGVSTPANWMSLIPVSVHWTAIFAGWRR